MRGIEQGLVQAPSNITDGKANNAVIDVRTKSAMKKQVSIKEDIRGIEQGLVRDPTGVRNDALSDTKKNTNETT